MRLIDADALKQTFCAECDRSIKCDDCDIDYHFEYLAPTVDAVPVVRCKDCKWYKEGSELYPMRFCYRLKNDDGFPVGYNWADNDFCSHSERREDETD